MDTQNNNNRSSFSGKIGYVLSAAGASVGLGNIWRFPYLAAKYGGGIFLLIYILLALTFGYTMIVAESAIGRMTRKSPVGAFRSFGKKKWLSFGGWINAIIPVLIVPYYSVIGGWVIKYLVEYVKGNGKNLAKDGYFTDRPRPCAGAGTLQPCDCHAAGKNRGAGGAINARQFSRLVP